MYKTIILLSLLLSTIAYGQVPSYESILNFMHNNIELNPQNGHFEISKSPEGYFVNTAFYGEDNSIERTERQQIWNAKTNSFILPVYPNTDRYQYNYTTEMTARFRQLWYNRKNVVPFIYYGYPGWVEDTQLKLEGKQNLTPKELENLARAYYIKANDYIHPNQYGLRAAENESFIGVPYGKTHPNRVKNFKEAYDKNLEYWQLIQEKYPEHKPHIIRDLDLKTANEYMHGFLIFKTLLEHQNAAAYLDAVNYPKSFISYAKLLLNSCEQDGILFTNGDTDTYPLWYVQEKLNYRNDVTVINLSLAQTSWYMEYLMDQKNLKTTFTAEEVREMRSLLFLNDGEETFLFSDWRDDYRALENKTKISDPIHPHWISVNGQWEIKRGDVYYRLKKEEHYTFGYIVVLYDVLSSQPERPIYATHEMSFSELGLENYTRKNGFLIQLDTIRRLYMTDDEEESIFESFESLPDGYILGLGGWRDFTVMSYLNTALRIRSNLAEEITPIVKDQILSVLPTKEVSTELATWISDFYIKFNRTQLEDFLIEYEGAALKFITGFQPRFNKVFDDSEGFYDLISIYTSTRKYQLNSHEKKEYEWHGSKDLFEELKSKLTELQGFCEKHRLDTSHTKVKHMLLILNQVNLD